MANQAFVSKLAARLVALEAPGRQAKEKQVQLQATAAHGSPETGARQGGQEAQSRLGQPQLDWEGMEVYTFTKQEGKSATREVKGPPSVVSTGSTRSARSHTGNYTFCECAGVFTFAATRTSPPHLALPAAASRLDAIEEENLALAKRLDSVGRQRSMISFRSVDVTPIRSNRGSRRNLAAQRIARENRRLYSRLHDAKTRVYDDAAARAKYDRNIIIHPSGTVKRVQHLRHGRSGRQPTLPRSMSGRLTVDQVAALGGRSWGTKMTSPGDRSSTYDEDSFDSPDSHDVPGPGIPPVDGTNPQALQPAKVQVGGGGKDDTPHPSRRPREEVQGGGTFLTQSVGLQSPSTHGRLRTRVKGTPHPAAAARAHVRERQRPWRRGAPPPSHKRAGSHFSVASVASASPRSKVAGSPRWGRASPRRGRAVSPRAQRQAEMRATHKARLEARAAAQEAGRARRSPRSDSRPWRQSPRARSTARRGQPAAPGFRSARLPASPRAAKPSVSVPRGSQSARGSLAPSASSRLSASPRHSPRSARSHGSPRQAVAARRFDHLQRTVAPKREYARPWATGASSPRARGGRQDAASPRRTGAGAAAEPVHDPASEIRRAIGLSVAGAAAVSKPVPKGDLTVEQLLQTKQGRGPRRVRSHAGMY